MEVPNSSAATYPPELTTNTCRVCLLTDPTNQCIYSMNNGSKSPIGLDKKLEMLGGIELTRDDELPTKICVDCISKVNSAYHLWKQCQESDEKLRGIFKKPRSKLSMNTIVMVYKNQSCQTEPTAETNDHKIRNSGGIVASPEQMLTSEPQKPLSAIKPEKILLESDKLEWRRTKRLSMFKRVTSIQNLKSHKERQRQYIKINKNAKFEGAEENNSWNRDNSYERVSNHKAISPLHKCSQCNRASSNEKSLCRHSLSHDTGSISCKICNKSFKKIETMIRHLNIHKKVNLREVFDILQNIRAQNPSETPEMSRTLTENTEINPKSCDSENLNPKSTIKLINTWIKEQLGSDNEAKYFSCSICNKSYTTKKSLLKHRRMKHLSTQEDSADQRVNNHETEHKCERCNKSFDKELQLKRHLRVHEDSNFRRYLCHICSKTFRQNTGLRFHMRTHTGYKPHVCNHCGRGFTSKSNCINHERTHTGDRPFVCHFCSAAFAKSCTLKAHITTHTGEANYHCKTCGKSFKRLKYLKEHRFTHTGEKPYACKICGTAYSHSGSLFVHEKKCKAQLSNQPSNCASAPQIYYATPPNVQNATINSDFNSLLPVHHDKVRMERVQEIIAGPEYTMREIPQLYKL